MVALGGEVFRMSEVFLYQIVGFACESRLGSQGFYYVECLGRFMISDY